MTPCKICSICLKQWGRPWVPVTLGLESQELGPELTLGVWGGGVRGYRGSTQHFPVNQVTQLTKVLDALLEGEIEDPDLLECYFLEALYCSLGAALLDEGRARFDECVKRLASLPSAETDGVWAKPGELPGGNRVLPVLLLRIL